jgi:cell division initiation protein
MRITPIDIQQHQFRTRALGYDKAAVDHFLELIAEELEEIHRQHHESREELARCRASLEELRERESTLKETLLTTQRVTDELKANARREAELMVAEAQLQGQKIVQDAEEQRMRLVAEIRDLQRRKIAFESGLRAQVESHLRLLEMEKKIPQGDPLIEGPSDWRLLLERDGSAPEGG